MTDEGIPKKPKQKSKKKTAKESKNSVLEKAHKYVDTPVTNLEGKAGQFESKRKLETGFGEEEELVLKRKATEADKERKREKSHLKRQKKKEEKAKKKSKEETNEKAKENALQYLKMWYTDRHNWSFKKIQQIWLLKNLYQMEQISDDDFDILLEYLVGLKGAARDRLVREAEKFIQTWDCQLQSENSSSDGTWIGLNDKTRNLFIGEEVRECAYNRARMILQTLE
ncbi:uncharacterized protein LOC143244478 isoform X2 [Tachypleus tridentatus]|uniref:uncharacterized protein LOC143244478 isoform X2 n=1 Tax=Tachypleus tridentatus TaxID=6853 RepID=UPI003FD36A8A